MAVPNPLNDDPYVVDVRDGRAVIVDGEEVVEEVAITVLPGGVSGRTVLVTWTGGRGLGGRAGGATPGALEAPAALGALTAIGTPLS